MHNSTDLVYNNHVDNNMVPNPSKSLYGNENGNTIIYIILIIILYYSN